MSPINWKACFVAASVALAISLPLVGSSQALEQVLSAQERRIRLAQESQEKIDAEVKDTRRIADQYKAALKEIEGLKVYNTLLSLQVDNQKAKMGDLRNSIDQVEVINRQIVPIMTQMIEGLKQFVELDVPFLLEERQERVARLEELMERDDVTVAEKFRKVTEAYQIENDYGRTIESYKDTQEQEDGTTREVDMLRIGRVALLYQTPDGQISKAWNQKEGIWQDSSDQASQIKFGLRIATKQVAPDLILLPVSAPEAG